jgi:hypothetical protein
MVETVAIPMTVETLAALAARLAVTVDSQTLVAMLTRMLVQVTLT